LDYLGKIVLQSGYHAPGAGRGITQIMAIAERPGLRHHRRYFDRQPQEKDHYGREKSLAQERLPPLLVVLGQPGESPRRPGKGQDYQKYPQLHIPYEEHDDES